MRQRVHTLMRCTDTTFHTGLCKIRLWVRSEALHKPMTNLYQLDSGLHELVHWKVGGALLLDERICFCYFIVDAHSKLIARHNQPVRWIRIRWTCPGVGHCVPVLCDFLIHKSQRFLILRGAGKSGNAVNVICLDGFEIHEAGFLQAWVRQHQLVLTRNDHV